MSEKPPQRLRKGWPSLFRSSSSEEPDSPDRRSARDAWSMGILNDKRTIEVPGSVLLLAPDHNEPLGLRNAPARTSSSSIPIGAPPPPAPKPPPKEEKKKTNDGKIILEPQPEDSANDPLNWPSWRRDTALLVLGFYCMICGGITPLLAAGFTDVSEDYDVDVADVSLTTGLYMMGMGIGCVIFSPTAILWGKRPVYLFGAVLLIATSCWCAASPSFTSLILARIFQGIAVSPVECLPSATIAEIFFLHERAFRIGIYTLLLLGGKNIVPLVSAVVIGSLGWRWVFWIVAIIVAFFLVLLFLFVPETFWDRTPVRKRTTPRPNFFRRLSSRLNVKPPPPVVPTTHVHHGPADSTAYDGQETAPDHGSTLHRSGPHHVEFAPGAGKHPAHEKEPGSELDGPQVSEDEKPIPSHDRPGVPPIADHDVPPGQPTGSEGDVVGSAGEKESTPQAVPAATPRAHPHFPDGNDQIRPASPRYAGDTDSEKLSLASTQPGGFAYTATLRESPARSFSQQLRPFHGRLHRDRWHKVATRPLILFLYPSVLWSAVVYSCSIGWLIVISESIAVIYRDGDTYNFNAIQTGLVYISPFVGGILGTAVAGKVSDVIVMAMARRNGGLYEPEFRLVMAAPITLTTVIGLMGFGWSAEAKDNFMVPTIFFGVVSFGCSLGSTTSITFCVDSYRQYAGEALVTLNFSKNIFHGLVFSLFVTEWLTSDGSKSVFIWIGIIQLILMLFSIPMYIYGKRARMWTVRKNLMEKF